MSKPIVAFDSCTILHLLAETPAWRDHVKKLYDAAAMGQYNIVVSEISVVECTHLVPQGTPGFSADDAATAIRQFFNRSFVIRRGITSRESELAVALKKAYGLSVCDALVAATAVYADAHTLYTTDGCSFRKKPGKLLTVGFVLTPCGRNMKVEPPDLATCKELQAAPIATSKGDMPPRKLNLD